MSNVIHGRKPWMWLQVSALLTVALATAACPSVTPDPDPVDVHRRRKVIRAIGKDMPGVPLADPVLDGDVPMPATPGASQPQPNPQLDIGTILLRQSHDPDHCQVLGWRPKGGTFDEVWIFHSPGDTGPGFRRFLAAGSAPVEISHDGRAPDHGDGVTVNDLSRAAFLEYAKLQCNDSAPANFRTTTFERIIDPAVTTDTAPEGMFQVGVYKVTETNHPKGVTDPVAWVWRPVVSGGSLGVAREIWLLFDENLPTGYFAPGHVLPKNAPTDPNAYYVTARFKIEGVPDAPPVVSPLNWIGTDPLGDFYDVLAFMNWVDQQNAHVTNVDQLAARVMKLTDN